MIPGEYILKKEPVDYNVGYEAIKIKVKNIIFLSLFLIAFLHE